MGNQEESGLAVLPAPVAPPLPKDLVFQRLRQVPHSHFQSPDERWDELVDSLAKYRTTQVEREEEARIQELRSLLARLKHSQRAVLDAAKEEKEPPSFKPSKPKLDAAPRPGGRHYMRKHLEESILSIEAVGGMHTKIQEDWIVWMCNWIDSLSEKIVKHIKASAEKLKQNSTWTILAQTASGILATISLLFGVSLVATGAGASLGGILITSGFLALVNLVAKETRAWDWVAEQIAGDNLELRNQLRTWIPAGISLLAMMTGAVGSIMALFTQAFTTVPQIILIGNNLTEIGEAISRIGKGVTQYGYLTTQAERDLLQAHHELSSGDLSAILGSLREMSKAIKTCFSSARRSLMMYARGANLRQFQV